MHKTAYEMLISDWSSDVFVSDLLYQADFQGSYRQAPFQLMQEFAYCGVDAILDKLKTGETTATEMLISTLGRIESHNPRLGAVTEIMEQPARQEAARIDAQREHGDTVGPLEGLAITLKGILATTHAPGSTAIGGALFREKSCPYVSRSGVAD